jgi:hypothetical protein
MLALVALRNNMAEEGSHRKVAQHWVVHYPLAGGGSLLYDSSSFIFLRWDKESLFQPIFPPLDEKPKPRIRKG